MNWEMISKDQSASVMDEARELGRAGGSEGAVICAKSQTAGRGRQGHIWISPEGGLYCAILLRPQWELSRIPFITLVTAVAVCEAVQESAGVDAKIKWPNDILIDGKKIAGILVESEIKGKNLEHVVVGVGMNVNTAQRQLPEEGVSLRGLCGKEYSLSEILGGFLNRMSFRYEQCHGADFEAVIKRWKALCETLGQRVQYAEGQGVIEGEALDLDDDGALLIRCDDGQIMRKHSGEISRCV